MSRTSTTSRRLGIAVALAASAWAVPSWAEWTVSKHPMGPGYVVSDSTGKSAGFTAPTQASAQAQADVLNKFEKKQAKRDK
jgi:hypothetical protein